MIMAIITSVTDLIFASGLSVILERIESVKAQSSISPPPCLDGELIYAHPQRLMEPRGFQAALHNPNFPSHVLDDLVNDWNFQLSETIKTWHPLSPHPQPAFCYTEELHEMKQEL